MDLLILTSLRVSFVNTNYCKLIINILLMMHIYRHYDANSFKYFSQQVGMLSRKKRLYLIPHGHTSLTAELTKQCEMVVQMYYDNTALLSVLSERWFMDRCNIFLCIFLKLCCYDHNDISLVSLKNK